MHATLQDGETRSSLMSTCKALRRCGMCGYIYLVKPDYSGLDMKKYAYIKSCACVIIAGVCVPVPLFESGNERQVCMQAWCRLAGSSACTCVAVVHALVRRVNAHCTHICVCACGWRTQLRARLHANSVVIYVHACMPIKLSITCTPGRQFCCSSAHKTRA